MPLHEDHSEEQYASQVIGVQDFGITTVGNKRILNADDYRNGPQRPGITIVTGSPVRASEGSASRNNSPDGQDARGRIGMNQYKI